MADNFTHLHLHTIYSLLDGANRISDCVDRLKELDMKSCAITDHNHIGGVIDFQNACKENGIKPLLGCEMYQTWDTNILRKEPEERREYAIEQAKKAGVEIPEKVDGKKITKKQVNEIIKPYSYDTKQYHLIIIAMNQTGYNNLVKLQSEAANTCTFNGRYCCDFEMLKKYNEGLIISSACLGGMIPNSIMKDELELARNLVKQYKDIFGDRFFLEIQPLDDPEQVKVNNEIFKIAKEFDIKIIATNDVHYTRKEDIDDHDTLLCVGTGKKKDDPTRMRYAPEFWIRSYDEMIEAFKRNNYPMDIIKEALSNTNLIADMVDENIKLGSDTPLFPEVYIPKGFTPEQYLTLKTYKQLYKYRNKKNRTIDIVKYEKRLLSELDIINSKGFAPYILKILENVEYCEANDIPLGPGRGSAAGALTLFLNGATKVVDPIKYDLLFFRFLTKDRVDPPDVDMDFSYYGRDKLIRHLEEQHGQEAVCHIGTYTELGVKSGLKDFGRVLNYSFTDMNEITKKIDIITEKVPGIKFKDIEGLKEEIEILKTAKNNMALDSVQKRYDMYLELKNEYPELFRLAMRFEGTPRNMGVHASGILVMPCPINDYFPTRTDESGIKIALFTGPQLESLGAIKLDILGLKTLDVLDKTLKAEDPNAKVNDLYDLIEEHMDDPEIYQQVKDKECEGLFQIESNLFKMLAEDMNPEDEKDICAMLAIGRPGPLSAGMHTAYAKRKSGEEEAIPQLRGTDEITEDTYHTIIYQEQCMLIAKLVAGFDDSQADSILRKALAKKKADKMELARRLFIYGKINSEPPADYNEENVNQAIYDPKGKYGAPVLGGVNNGYTEEELTDFWEKLKGYASYLFNKSHSASYAIITLCTMFLKKHTRAKFFAALLSMQSKEEKIDLYSKIAKAYGIKIKTPDINYSGYDFIEKDGEILYGLKSIKGVGEASIPDIIKYRPYKNIEDAISRVPKKSLNKRVLTGLIKSGAFDFENENRYALLNHMMDLRKDKDDRFIAEVYDREQCMELENKVLGTSLTYTPWFNTIEDKEVFTKEFTLESVSTRPDKRGNTMAFAKLKIDGQVIDALVFSKTYCKNVQAFDKERTHKLTITGRREGEKIIVSKVESFALKDDIINNNNFMDIFNL